MTRQHTNSWNLKPIAGVALAGLGIAVLLGGPELATAQLSHFLGTAAWGVLGVLPSIVAAAWQALQAYAFGHDQFLLCPVRMLVSLWPLVTLAAAV
jgi:hypothetical protein